MGAYLRILTYGKPYAGLGLLALVGMLFYALFNATSLILLGPFLEILFQNTPQTLPESPIDWADAKSLKAHLYYELGEMIRQYGRQSVLPYFCGILFVVILLKNFGRYFSIYFFSPLEQGIIQQLRMHVFDHITRLDMSFYTQYKKGDLIGTVVSDIQVIQEAIIGTLQNIFREPITVIFILVGLFFISWQLTLFTLIVLPLSGIFINYIRRSLKRKSREGQEILGGLIAVLDEFTTGIRIVKSFQKEAYERDRYHQKNDFYTRLQISIRRRSELASPVAELLSIGVICITIIYGGTLIFSDQASSMRASEFIVFIGLFSQLLSPIKLISGSIAKIQKGMAAFERIEELLARRSRIVEIDNPVVLQEFCEGISFEQVYFKYEEEDVLRDISFEMPKGSMIALVGPSGGGKSTLADLIPRFYDPYQGAIYIDGYDIRRLSLKGLRSFIGHVSQEGILFHDSILSNIAYGEKEPDREAVMQAAKIANAHDFIMQLPQQYDTVIGERGTKLSGGQRQRIGIARAILRNPAILILDEATSNLDTESERLVQDALERLMQNRTSLVIAHRLSTILKADQILVLEHGRIKERGTHSELLMVNGLYRKLYDLQFES